MKTLTLCLLLISILLHQGLSASITGNEMEKSAERLPLQQTENPRVQDYLLRMKRHSVLSICVFCCNCCRGSKDCVYCCKT
ncbi:hepcidin [Engystomops pustulosus]|uniref:hepcidin n=1 Tax=Engystomops pustulosus TaxID=76066 RepID=UPI003AFAD4B0